MELARQTIEKLSLAKEEDMLIRKIRLKAYELFESLPMPDLRYGISIKLNADGLDLSRINPVLVAEKITHEIKAPSSVLIEELGYALATNPIVREHFMRHIAMMNKMDALCAAFWQSGRVIYVPKGTILKEPIRITTHVDSDTHLEYLLVIVEDSCEISIVEDISSKQNDILSYRGKIAEVVVMNNSIVHYANVQNISRDFFNFVNKIAVVGRNSSMNWLDCCLGSRFSKSDISTVLRGEGASTTNYGLFFGSSTQQFDLKASTIHGERNTVCDMLTKGALTDRARAIYSGLVKINANASGSNGYQKEDTLLLSPDAEADSIPQLEIDNNEVRCTHGATVGQVDKEKLFYLMSRGLPENIAKKKIVEGFFEPMIQKIAVAHIQDRLREIVSEKIVI